MPLSQWILTHTLGEAVKTRGGGGGGGAVARESSGRGVQQAQSEDCIFVFLLYAICVCVCESSGRCGRGKGRGFCRYPTQPGGIMCQASLTIIPPIRKSASVLLLCIYSFVC